MTEEYKIEKGLPIPGGYASKYPWADMEIGDSFWVSADDANPKKHQSKMSSIACCRGARHGEKYSTRREGAGVRVWRVK